MGAAPAVPTLPVPLLQTPLRRSGSLRPGNRLALLRVRVAWNTDLKPRGEPVPDLPILAYVEHCLPGADVGERLRLARRHDLALEIANRQGLEVERLRGSGAVICTVQAWEMHDVHPIHPDPAARRSAEVHVRRTIELAERLGAPRVLTVCGYGSAIVDAPFERCRDFFARLVPFARDRGVRLLVERLGRSRAAAMTAPEAIDRLLDEVGAPDVLGRAVDTGHLLDDGLDPAEILRGRAAEELQLRGPGSTPPSADLPVRRWLEALPARPAIVAVEHHEPTGTAELELLLRTLRGAVQGRFRRDSG